MHYFLYHVAENIEFWAGLSLRLFRGPSPVAIIIIYTLAFFLDISGVIATWRGVAVSVILLRATGGARNPNLQVVTAHASHVCSLECTERNFITCVWIFYHS